MKDALSKLIESHKVESTKLEFGELVITVDPMALPTARASAVITAANLVFNEFDDGVDGYMPAFLEFAHRYGAMQCYTDFDVPQKLEHAWAALMQTPIYSKVKEVIGEDAMWEFDYQLDELIEARKQERIHMVNANKVFEHLGGIADSITDKFKDLDMNDILTKFKDIPKVLESLPKMEGTDVGNIIKNFLSPNATAEQDK